MRIGYFRAGIDSLEMSLEHLERNTGRDLRAAILLGFHGILCLLKIAAVRQGIVVKRKSKSVPFPILVGSLKAKRWLSSTDSKALRLLNELRNSLEHEEVEYDRERFKVALHGTLPILERVMRECSDTDLQEEISDESWDTLLEIEEFFSYREKALGEIVEEALDKASDPKDALIDPAEAVYCGECNHRGLPWKGNEREKTKCKFCGIISLIAVCNICNGSMIINEDDEWPYMHEECWNNIMGRDD